MCTAATYRTKAFYFGRTLDYELSYGEEVVVTPKNFPFSLRRMGNLESHHAMIGMAHVISGCPLFYDAINEKGLAMAGLNFVGNAVYRKDEPGKDNVATFEFIPWILGQAATVSEAKKLLAKINLLDIPFGKALPAAQLHWIIADRQETITVESVSDGLRIYDNPVGILTNNPPFDWQLMHLNSYMHLSPKAPRNLFSDSLPLKACSRGMGAIGLPGDLSSQSRFVRAAFVRANSVSGASETESVGQFFHMLGAVEHAVIWAMGNMRLPFTPHAAMPTRESTITPPMETARSRLLTCTEKIWRAPGSSDTLLSRRNRSGWRTEFPKKGHTLRPEISQPALVCPLVHGWYSLYFFFPFALAAVSFFASLGALTGISLSKAAFPTLPSTLIFPVRKALTTSSFPAAMS